MLRCNARLLFRKMLAGSVFSFSSVGLYGSGETSKFLNLIIWDYALEWRKSKLKSNDSYIFSYTMHAWKKPPEKFFKLNIDGTRVSPIGKIGAGGVIWNHYGDWISGFQINLGAGEILDAEACGLFQGLKLAVSLNIKNLIIESDSAILVQLMNNSEFGNHPLGSLLQRCNSFLNKMESVTLSHIFRKCNYC
ncbi:hypothetical protein ACLB2K_013109 [Fragaria x ananassa]